MEQFSVVLPFLVSGEKQCFQRQTVASKDTIASAISFCIPPSFDLHFLTDWGCGKKPAKADMDAS